MLRKEKKDNEYLIWEAEYEWCDVRILKNKNTSFYSVYVKRYAKIDGYSRWYIEMSSNWWQNLKQAKSIAEKLCDIALWYNPPRPWKEY